MEYNLFYTQWYRRLPNPPKNNFLFFETFFLLKQIETNRIFWADTEP